jgi:hypothetical protein
MLNKSEVPNTKFPENPSNGSRADTCGYTDRQDKANSRFSLFMQNILKEGLRFGAI